jgi:excisionase family DNA binding protein
VADLVQTDAQVKRELERVAYGMAEAAEAIGIGVTSFSELVMSGHIPTFRIGRRRLVTKKDLIVFVDRMVEEQNR